MKLRVGIVGAAVGLHGEVRLRVTTDRPDLRFVTGATFEVDASEQSKLVSAGLISPELASPMPTSLKLNHARWHKDTLIVKFEGVENRTDAESLRSVELYATVDAGEEEDSYHFAELVGLKVYLDETEVGEVLAVIPGSAQDLLEIKVNDGQKALVPFVEQIIPEVDTQNGRLTLTPPPGLLSVNSDLNGDTNTGTNFPKNTVVHNVADGVKKELQSETN